MREGAILDLIAKYLGVCLPIQDTCATALNGIDLLAWSSSSKESGIIMRQMLLFGLTKGIA
jgi:hypothetical protein